MGLFTVLCLIYWLVDFVELNAKEINISYWQPGHNQWIAIYVGRENHICSVFVCCMQTMRLCGFVSGLSLYIKIGDIQSIACTSDVRSVYQPLGRGQYIDIDNWHPAIVTRNIQSSWPGIFDRLTWSWYRRIKPVHQHNYMLNNNMR